MNHTKSKKQPTNFSQKIESDRIFTKKNHFSIFCLSTSLHGWKYLFLENRIWRKLLWLGVLIGVSGLGVFFLWKNLLEFTETKTATKMETTTASLKEIIFPSVFVCNVNQVTKSFLSSIGIRDDSSAASLFFYHFIDGVRYTSVVTQQNGSDYDAIKLAEIKANLKKVFNWTDSIPITRLAAHNCSDLLIYTEWSTVETHSFYNAFQSVTDYGTCCLLVPYLDFINPKTKLLDPSDYTADDFHKIPTGAHHSVPRGLKLIIDVETFDYAYFPRAPRGVKISMADGRDKGVINQDGYYLSPGSETLAAITPTKLVTTQSALDRFIPLDRGCYEDSEFGFNYLKWTDGYRYSIKNCLYEAVIDKIVNNCSCFPSFAATRKSQEYKICFGKSLACAIEWLQLLGNTPDPDLTNVVSSTNKTLKCLQRCDFQAESTFFSSSSYPSWNVFIGRKDFCFILQKVNRLCADPVRSIVFEASMANITCKEINYFHHTLNLCKNTLEPNEAIVRNNEALTRFLFDYAKHNTLVLKMFIKDPYYTKIVRSEGMSVISFISTAGGLLGLCMGLSFVSIFEILYHFFNFLVQATRKSLC